MNYMADVAKLFGLELGEKFKINSAGDISSDEYYIDENSIHEVCDGRVNDYCYPLLIALLNGKDTVVKTSKPILNDAEREYLSKVIRPFRDKVKFIRKSKTLLESRGWITIDTETDFAILPLFEKDKMYIGMEYDGMEYDRHYTLEELGL